jgi:hypothetical protein
VGSELEDKIKSFLSQSIDRLLTEVEKRVEGEKESYRQDVYHERRAFTESALRIETLNRALSIIAELKK